MNDKILCYLTEDANQALSVLRSAGFDEDLALSFLETVWPETDIYSIPLDLE